MKTLSPDHVIGWFIVTLTGVFVLLVLVLAGWGLYSGISDRQDQRSCRDSGGDVVHVAVSEDWRCARVK